MNLLPYRIRAVAILLFLPQSRLRRERNPYVIPRLSIAGPRAWTKVLGTKFMARLNALLHSTRSRIARRLAQIVDIAAASLPAAGV
jgi:hypothetical protein